MPGPAAEDAKSRLNYRRVSTRPSPGRHLKIGRNTAKSRKPAGAFPFDERGKRRPNQRRLLFYARQLPGSFNQIVIKDERRSHVDSPARNMASNDAVFNAAYSA
jgi:hypothetical protein